MTSITYASGSNAIHADLFGADAAGPQRQFVLLVHGSDGYLDTPNGPWRTLIRSYAEALAQHNLIAMIPDYFAGAERPLPVPDILIQRRPGWLRILEDGLAYARTLANVDPYKIGMMGFSLGGHLGLRLRATAKLNAAVSLFAPILDGIGPYGLLKTAEIHQGDKDALVTSADAKAIERQLVSEGTATTLYTYPGASHGFVGNDAANRDAVETSTKRVVSFFSKL